MKCRTCAHCAITSRTNGFCHGNPPGLHFMRWFAAGGDDAIVPISHAIQLIPSYSAGGYPPVNPTNRGCRLHRFSIFTWLRWRYGKEVPVISPVVQTRG